MNMDHDAQAESRRDERGASAVEYGLLVAAIAAIIAVTVFALGGIVKNTLFDRTCNNIRNSMTGTVPSCTG
jgi:pilus assembly protein Flp/PilA